MVRIAKTTGLPAVIMFKHPKGLGFGSYEQLPRIPGGYEWVQKSNDFLFLKSPNGTFYYVDFPDDKEPVHCTFIDLIIAERRRATIWDAIRTRGKLKRGQFYRMEPESR